LQCAAVCCSVLQCAAVCCGVLQCVAVCCSDYFWRQQSQTEGSFHTLQHTAVCCSACSQCVAVSVCGVNKVKGSGSFLLAARKNIQI